MKRIEGEKEEDNKGKKGNEKILLTILSILFLIGSKINKERGAHGKHRVIINRRTRECRQS